MKLLSAFHKIARTSSIAIKSVSEPNPVLQVGIFNSVMGRFPQMDFLKVNISQNAIQREDDTGSYSNVTGKGKIYIPDEKQFYMGEGVQSEI